MAMLHAESEQFLLEDVCKCIVDIGGYRMAWIGYLSNDVKQSVLPMAYAGYQEGYLKKLNIDLTDTERKNGPSGKAIITGISCICRNILTDPSFAVWRDDAIKNGYNASIAIPLSVSDSRPFGVLTIYSEEEDIFDEEEAKLLNEIGSELAYCIFSIRVRDERNLMSKELKINLEKMKRILMQTVDSLATSLEIRDPYTAGHQKKVAKIAKAIAKKMNLPDDQIEGISVAAALHDIGKMFVSSEILSRPGKISEVEFKLIQTHCQAGYDIIKGIEFPWPVRDMVLQHHERINGSGYPQGLTGEKILLGSKILAVADVVEAISSFRPYRPALGVDAAIEEITTNKGILYDPEVVDACLGLF